MKTAALLMAALLAISGCAMAQSTARARAEVTIDLDFLADMLRSASAAHAKVRDMELEKKAVPDRPDGGRSGRQTAEMIGTGAGIGAAIGGMSRNQKGVVIGVIAGSAGGLIIDQILRHRAEKERERNAEAEQEPTVQPQLKERPAPRR